VRQTSPGTFLSAWFGGQAEGFPDTGIYISRLVFRKSLNASQWSDPRQVRSSAPPDSGGRWQRG
jgi:hypothetical protein